MSNYILSATLELKDQFTAQVNKARSGFRDLTGTLKDAGIATDSVAAGMGKAGTAASRAAQQTDKAKRSFQGIRGTYEATIRAKDNATEQIRKVKAELNGLKGKAYTVALNVRANAMKDKGLQDMKNAMSGMAGGMLMGTSMQMAGAAGIGFGIYNTLKTSMDFSAALSGVKALVPAGEDAEAVMEAVKNKAMELGQATAFGDVDVANGMAELLKAGLSLQEVLNGATKAALDLATAGDLSLPEAAKTMSIMMNVFDLNDASHAADILTGAANASATNVHEMSYAMAEAAAGAKSMGVSFEDTNATLALFAKNGLLGSDAGTSLKTMLSRLVPQTDQAAKDFQRLGLMSEDGSNKFFDATGKLKPMREVAETLKKSLQGMTAEQKQAALYTIFGSDAIRAATFLAQDGAEGIDKMTVAMKRFTASGVAETKMDNLRGDIEQLSGSWENLQILIMDGKGENGLRDFVKEADKLLSNFSGVVEEHGLGARSVLSLIGEGIKDLKDKFLAFDGIGSVLAGGALAFGLKKLYDLAQKVRSSVQGLITKSSKPPAGPESSTTGVKDMMVSARTVIVNGKESPSNTPSTQVPGTPGTKTPSKTKTPSSSRIGGVMRRLPVLGGLTYLAGSALNVAYAPEEERGVAISGAVGGGLGWLGGAKLGAMAGGLAGPVGAAIGGLAGGIGGGLLGEKLGDAFARIDWDRMKQPFSRALSEMKADFANMGPRFDADVQDMAQKMGQAWEDMKTSAGQKLDSLNDWASDTWDDIQQGAEYTGQGIVNSFSEACANAENAWADFCSWFDSNVCQPLAGLASSAADKLTELGSAAASVPTFGGSGPLDSAFSSIFPLRHNASGSSYYSGGWTEINERGGEIVDLPQGSRIYPHATTERMIQNELDGSMPAGGPVVVKGNTFYVREEADIDRIAYKLAKLISQGHVNYGGGY